MKNIIFAPIFPDVSLYGAGIDPNLLRREGSAACGKWHGQHRENAFRQQGRRKQFRESRSPQQG